MSNDKEDLLFGNANFMILHSLLKKRQKTRHQWMKYLFEYSNIYGGSDFLSDL